MLCRLITMIAMEHCSVVALPPYPIVCWVSRLKRKHEVKSLMLSTHTTCSFGLSSTRSPWTKATRYQTTAKTNQDKKKEAAKPMKITDQDRSMVDVKKSFRNLWFCCPSSLAKT